MWVTLKFGGTSVSTHDSWRSILSRIRTLRVSSPLQKVWVVVSAISQVTNNLERCLDQAKDHGKDPTPVPAFQWIVRRHIKLARSLGLTKLPPHPQEDFNRQWDPLFQWELYLPDFVASKIHMLDQTLQGIQLTGEVSCRLRARVLATGELCSSHLGYLWLSKQLEDRVEWADSRKLLRVRDRPGETEDSKYLNADVAPIVDVARAEAEANGAYIVISQGFIASTSSSDTALLGRGGSDTSGALIAALLSSVRYEVWTDVHGLFSCDPRQVPTARLISEISYREAQELASMGAKVLHPRCLGPAGYAGIPVEVHNTLDPQSKQCTKIQNLPQSDEPQVMAVARRTGQVLLTLENFDMWGAHGFLAKCFAPFERNAISVDLIATSQYAVSMTLDHIPGGVEGQQFKDLRTDLSKLGKVSVVTSCVVVSIVGRRLRSALGMLGKVFDAFEGENVLLVSESTEDLNLSFVIENGEKSNALVKRMHDILFDDSANESKLFGPTWQELKGRLKNLGRDNINGDSGNSNKEDFDEKCKSPSWTQESKKATAAVASTPSGSPRPSSPERATKVEMKTLNLENDSLLMAEDAEYLRALLAVAPGAKKFIDEKYLVAL